MTDYLNYYLSLDEMDILTEYFKRGVKVDIPRHVLAESDSKLFQDVMMDGKGLPSYQLWIKDLREEQPHYVIVSRNPGEGTRIIYTSRYTDMKFADIVEDVQRTREGQITQRVWSGCFVGSIFFGLACLYGSFLLTLPMSKSYLEAQPPSTMLLIAAIITSIFMIPTLLVYFTGVHIYTPRALAEDKVLRLVERYRKSLPTRKGGVCDIEI